MRTLLRWGLILIVIVGVLTAIGVPLGQYWKERNRVRFREAEVSRGKIVAVVNATGTIKPVRSVQVGAFVSGPIIQIPKDVDFNKEVKKDQLLAKIDPRLYEAAVRRDKALLQTREAELEQVKVKFEQSERDWVRAQDLAKQNKGFISAQEMDQFRYARLALKAQVAFAEASKVQAEANLETSLANLKYTDIVSPEDGIIIDRKIDEGQTVQASFQTPDLFVVAPDLRKEVYVLASVDETDIDLISAAKEKGHPVRFTIDARPDDLFEGKIFQIRQNSSTVQNVVTYPVVISAANPDLKLKPGTTANVSFQIGERTDKLRIPNAALRFFPQRELVHPDDRKILEGAMHIIDPEEQTVGVRSAEEKAELRRQRSRRHVWVQDGDFLRAIEVIVGLSDSRYTEIVSSEGLTEGTKLITGIRPKN